MKVQRSRTIPRRTPMSPCVASFAQERLWLLDRLKPDGAFNTISAAMRLTGQLDLSILEQSLNEVVERHETLRTIFTDGEGYPIPVVVPVLTLTIPAVDLTVLPSHQREGELQRLLAEKMQLPFDLTLGPLVRATLLKLGEEEHVLLVCVHQIICDNQSIDILMAELASVYTAAVTRQPMRLPKLHVQYADFALYQRESLNPEVLDELLADWRRHFSSELPILELPVDRLRPPVETLHGAQCYLDLDLSLSEALEALSRQEEVALSTLLLAAFLILLRRYTSQDQILVGMLVDGREPEETRELIGHFVNTLVARTDLSGNPTFREFLQRVRETVAETYTHRAIPFEKLVEALQPERDISRHPIVQTMFTMQDTSRRSLAWPGLGVTVVELERRTTNFDLSINWTKNEAHLKAVLEYNPDLFEASTIERMAKHSESLLQSIVANPEQRILNLPFLTTVERQQLLGEWNETGVDYPEQICMHELFEAQVSESPEVPAVICEDEQLTYAQLNQRANEVAHRLRASGVGPGVVAGICIERSIEMVVGLMGIVKAGGAYLPLDPTYPPERLSFMLEDARARVVLTQERLLEKLGQQHETEVICIDSQWPDTAFAKDENVRSGVTPDDLIYLIYTSGSTGQPKGVMLNHRGRVNNFSDFNRRFRVGEGDRLLALSSLSFDMCAYDVFGTLAAGATIVLPEAARTLDPAHWADLMVRHKVSLWHSVPALLELLVEHVEAHPKSRPGSLRLALLGGDWIPVSLPDRVKALAEEVQVISLGGATEASMDSTIFSIETTDPTWKSIPYGVPMANQHAYVLDESLQLVPVGVRGELYLGGVGLAWGYFDRPDLTAEKFIPHPFGRKPGERLYHTGDLARYYPDGNLELIGRSDFQVKIRGFRIELGEIAAALRQHPAVHEAVVLAREDQPGNKQLVAYVVPHPESAATVRRMLRLEKEAARNDLARYELPNGMSIVHLNKGETDFLYHEIFEEESYLSNGVSLPEKPCIFDVGANIGLFSLFIGQTYPDAKIYAFEPVPDAFQALRANAIIYGLDAKVFESGISNQDKSSTLTYYPNFSIGSSAFADPQEARDVIKAFLTNTKQLQVDEKSTLSEALVDELLHEQLTSREIICQFRTISSVIAEQGIENIDLLKIDAEKSEVEVLAGIAAEDWSKIKHIVIEVHGRDRLEEIVPLLESHDYRLVIEQSGALNETALYNVHALRQPEAGEVSHRPERAESTEVVDRWSNPQQLRDEINAFLKQQLPEQMLPAALVLLEAFPLTPNGKVDRRGLPKPEAALLESPRIYVPATTALEQLLAGIWQQLLGIKQIGINDDFFKLGGHSLLATQLISRISSMLHIDLSLRSIFDAPTVAEQAQQIEMAQHAGQGWELPRILPVSRESELPASYAQQRLWFLDKLVPHSAVYNIPATIHFTGELNQSALKQSLDEIVARHEVLRTSIVARGEKPVQIIAAPLSLEMPVVDLGAIPEAERRDVAEQLARDEGERPFDLSRSPLIRVKLLRLAARDHWLLLTMHHIVSDGWSLGILVRELSSLYTSFVTGERPTLPELPIQYADFAHWQHESLPVEMLEAQLTYWKRHLDDAAVLDLPTDHPRPPMPSHRGSTQTFLVPATLTESLKELSQREGATLFMVLLAAFQTLLHRYSGQEDIVVGTPIANRNRAEVEGLIGFFVNMLVMRSQLSGEMKFSALLAQVREAALEAYAHKDVPFERLVEELQSERDLSRHPLFQVAFVLETTSAFELELPGLKMQLLPYEERGAKFDLTLLMEETADGLFGSFSYSTDLFDESTGTRMLEHLQRMLEAIASNPNQRLADLPMMGAAERQQILFDWNNNDTDYPREQCVHQLFEAQVDRAPEAIAVGDGRESLNYRDLNSRANQLADYLRQSGVGSESLVGIMMERSVDTIVALLGILKAGAAYLPLEPSHPVGRLQTILSHARPAILITQSSLRDTLALDTTFHVLCIDSEWPTLAANYSSANATVLAQPDNLAYLMYTSGSTGEPKGIAISQRSIVRLVKETNYASFSAAEVFLYLAPLSFDASTFEIWGALLNGARLAVMPPGPLSLAALGAVIVQEKVSTLWLTASLFELMVDEQLEDLRGVRQLLSGGDVLSVRHVSRALRELPETTIINCYGPTENTTFTCTYGTEAEQIGGSVPIGVPISNTRVYVLDEAMKPVPVGVPGQLYTGGAGLARGYFEQAAMTAERFVPDPISGEAGARLYQTGDVVKYRNDGLLEFIERRDQQVKVRGFRIELGEIEAVLSRHQGVRQCVVVARIPGEESGLGSEEKRLVAYVVAEDEAVVNVAELRAYLKQELPEYMVPAAFMLIKAMPVTANGKVDRRALPEPEWSEDATTYQGATTLVEELLVGVWADVLGIEADRLGVSDNFFEIGGHSLLATQAVSRVRQVFKREMPVRVVFECPTVKEQAAWLEEEIRAGGAREVQLPMLRVKRDEPLALSFAQQRLWFLDQLSPGNTAYNISFNMVFEGPLNFAALEASVNEIVRRHESLRTTFAVVNDQPVQVIGAIDPLKLPVIDLEHSVAGEREAEVEEVARNERETPFDLTAGPLLRAKLLRFGAEEHVLLFTMHHIITDAWSEGILFDELRTLYHAFSNNEPSPLPELEIQYADFSAWQRKWLQGPVLEAQLAYWKKQLAGAPATLELPTDKPRPSVQTYQGARQSYLLSADLTEGVRTLCQREGTTLFMTLLAAFQTLLSRYTGQEDIVIGSPVAGRNRAEVEGLIGFFINTLVLRGDLHDDPSFKELLQRVREVTLEAYGQQDLPFEKLIEELNLGRDMSRSPLFQVFFNLLNASSESHQSRTTAVQRHVPPPVTKPTAESTKFDLTLYAVNQNEHIRLDLVYNTDLFEAATITRMFGHFQTLLEGILTNPEQRLSTLPIISEAERQELLSRRNLIKPEIDFVEFKRADSEQTIVSRFAEQVQLHPQNIAVKTKLYEWSYQTLDALSTQVSRQIVRLPERICLLFEHDAPMILGLLAALKAGKTYVPLDPQYPQERLSFIVKDAQAGAILTNTKNLSAAQQLANETVPVINIDTLDAETAGEDIGPEITPGAMAYILYTSGSAGQPKGVMQSHRNVLRHIASYTNNLHLNANDRLTLLSSYSFDAAVMDIYGALLNGATLCPFNIKEEGLNDFAHWLRRQEITIYHSTPTVYRYFVDTLGETQDFPLIRLLVLGGEEVFKRDVEHYRKHFSSECIFVNGLGPTESTVTLQYMIDKDSPLSDHRVPVGYAVEDTEVLLLNAHREPVAAYAIGEIAIKSDHVALGYWQQPVLTQQAFSQDAEDGDERIYHTGDLGRLLSDGSIEFLGRKDFQVKIRGYKIDFSEIETAILKNPAIREVLVNASDDQGEVRLAAYLVCDPQQPFDLEALRRSLDEQLPDYMIPAAFVILDALPLTPTGKLDRRALPAPDWTGSSNPSDVGGPRTPIEEVIAGIWSEVLGIEADQLGVHDNFFQRGGHSLLATLVISRVRDIFHTKFPLRMMFHTPTIAGLADAILEKLVEQEDGEHIEKLLREIEQLAPA